MSVRKIKISFEPEIKMVVDTSRLKSTHKESYP